MHYATISGAAVLLALAPSALALGSATLVNSCPFDIYYAPTSGSYEGMVALSPGGSYTSGYDEQGVGVSIKVGTSSDLGGPITQFEYTWADGKINYDISNINGDPFADNGVVLTPSMSGDPNNPTCLPVNCPAGDAVCTAAYNNPTDTDTMVCSEDSSLTMTVCAGSAKVKREPEPHHSAPELMHSHHRIHTRHFPRK